MNIKKLFVRGYVPEATFLRKKDRAAVRICREDCAVIDAANGFLILASRGERLTEGTDLRDALKMTEDDRLQFSNLLGTHKHFYMTADGLPLLIFSDFLSSTGLLLAVLPHAHPHAVLSALRLLNRTDFFLPPKEKAEKCALSKLRLAADQLSDILYYTDRILQAYSANLNNQYYLAHTAAFAGCALDFETVRAFARLNEPLKNPRTILFLLCTFLFLRNHSGALSAKDESPSVIYRITLRATDGKEKASLTEAPTFACAQCFSAYDIKQVDNGTTVIAFRDPAVTRALSCAFFGVPRSILLSIEAIAA